MEVLMFLLIDNGDDYGFTYFLNGNNLRISSLTCEPRNLDEIVKLNVGIMIDINCNTN